MALWNVKTWPALCASPFTHSPKRSGERKGKQQRGSKRDGTNVTWKKKHKFSNKKQNVGFCWMAQAGERETLCKTVEIEGNKLGGPFEIQLNFHPKYECDETRHDQQRTTTTHFVRSHSIFPIDFFVRQRNECIETLTANTTALVSFDTQSFGHFSY